MTFFFIQIYNELARSPYPNLLIFSSIHTMNILISAKLALLTVDRLTLGQVPWVAPILYTGVRSSVFVYIDDCSTALA